MKKSRKILSLLLSLVMLVSLLSGALAVQVADEAFTRATALEAGCEYLIVTEYEGKYYALNLPDGSGTSTFPTAVEVAVEGDAVASAPDAAVWLPDGSDHLESKANPGIFIFASSGGLTTWDGTMLLLLEKAAPGNFAGLPGDQPFSAFPGAVVVGAAEEAEPEPAPAEPEPAPVEPEPAPVEPEPAPAPVGQTYTVKAGDTLWSIAKRFYGSGFKWGDIYNANYDVIKNPRMIYVGQVLLIP